MNRRPVVFHGRIVEEEQVLDRRGYRRDDRVVPEDRAGAMKADAFVHVDARILAAHDVFGGRQESPERKRDERERKQRRRAGPRRQRAEAKFRDATRALGRRSGLR